MAQEASPRTRICILSRKDLSRVTRVVRQAKALCDSGYDVTVVSLKPPLDELLATTPEVEYLTVELAPWTRDYAIAKRRKLAARARTRTTRDRRRLFPRPPSGLVGSIRFLLVGLPVAALVRQPGESLFQRAREIRSLNPIELRQLFLRMLAQQANTVSFAERVCTLLRDRHFDVCQAHDNYALVAADRLSRATGAALIYDAVEITEHRLALRQSIFQRWLDRRDRRQEERLLRRADRLTTIGDALADWYANRYSIARPLVVRNCRYYWEHAPRQDIREDCGLAEHDRLVVWFGYAYPDQGLEAIVSAASRTPNSVHFALLADVLPRWVSFLEDVRAAAEAAGAGARFHVLPPRDPNDLISYVSGADLGIIPRPTRALNTYLSMPNKFLEMVMARLPIAVSDLLDMRRLVETYGFGEIFDVESADDIAGTLLRMLAPERHRALKRAVTRAARELCWEQESQPYVDLIQDAASAARQRRDSTIVAA